jgi:hypothetical protein
VRLAAYLVVFRAEGWTTQRDTAGLFDRAFELLD